MKASTIYAEKRKNGVVLKRVEIGKAILNNDCVSARKYNELKRKLLKTDCLYMVTETGLKDSFGGYPALHNVIFK